MVPFDGFTLVPHCGTIWYLSVGTMVLFVDLVKIRSFHIGLCRFFDLLNCGLSRFFDLLTHGLSRFFDLLTHGLSRFFGSLTQGLSRYFRFLIVDSVDFLTF